MSLALVGKIFFCLSDCLFQVFLRVLPNVPLLLPNQPHNFPNQAGALAEREKRETEVAGFKIDSRNVSCLVPHVFQEGYVRVFCTSQDGRKVQQAVRAFEIWGDSQ